MFSIDIYIDIYFNGWVSFIDHVKKVTPPSVSDYAAILVNYSL